MIIPIPFHSRNSTLPDDFEEAGNKWNPQLHFTGSLEDVAEVRFIESLLDKYEKHIVAHFIYSPWIGTYSVELQFGMSDQQRKALKECRQEYHAAFTRSGKLKRNVAEQFVTNSGDFKLIAVRPALPPEVMSIDPVQYERIVEDIVQGTWELTHYPAQYGLPLTMIVNENGIYSSFAYNRWGILGGFVVTRRSDSGSRLSLTDKQVEAVLEHLKDTEGGHLDPACGVNNAFREPFAIHGVPPSGWVPPTGKWFR